MPIPLDTLLRFGLHEEVEGVYHAVHDLFNCTPIERTDYISRLKRAFDLCEYTYEECMNAIDEYSKGDSESAEYVYKWTG